MAAIAAQTPFLAIEIHVERCPSAEHGRRCWVICVQGLPAPYKKTHQVILSDPFTLDTYHTYEKWIRKRKKPSKAISKSLHEDPSSWWRPASRLAALAAHLEPGNTSTEAETAFFTASFTESLDDPAGIGLPGYELTHNGADPPTPSISEYRTTLERALCLDSDSMQQYPRVKVYVCEDVIPQHPEHPSIHALMWELLEPFDSHFHPEPAIRGEGVQVSAMLPPEQGPRQPTIEVHRIFTGVKDPIKLTAGLREPEAPIRLLLVVARGLQVDWEKKFVDIQSVVHDTLCSMNKYLRSCGHHGRLQVDIVRPGTLDELKAHLGRDAEYDMVHLDVHGLARGMTDIPGLLFSRPGLSTAVQCRNGQVSLNNEVFEIVKVEVVAKLLADHGIPAVLLSACLSSWAQGKPLANMCRVFASHGIRIVTGISFTAWSDKVEAYYADFYPAIVLAKYGFRRAALHGRLSLQRRLISEHERIEKQQEMEQYKRANQRSQVQQQQQQQQQQQTKASKKQTFPTVTTYYAGNGKFDRTNSELLGVDLDRNLTQKPSTWLSRFWSRNPHLWTTLLPFLRRTLPSSMVTPADHLTNFEAFRARPENRNRLHSVGLMALEDRLKALQKVYIHMAASPGRPQLLRGVRESWLATNFAGRVEILSACYFRWSVLYFFLHLSGRFKRQRGLWGPKKKEEGSCIGRTVLIIDDVDLILKKGPALDRTAVERMDRYIRAAEWDSPNGIYVIFMSIHDVDWSKLTIDPDEFTWYTAQPFVAKAGLLVFRPPELTSK